jgi:hypothetical protein
MSDPTYTVLVPFTFGQWTYRAGEQITPEDLALRELPQAELDRQIMRGCLRQAGLVVAEAKIERITKANKAVTPPAESNS